MGEFMYVKAKEKNSPIFIATDLTRLDVIITTDYAIIRLKRSKTDKTY